MINIIKKMIEDKKESKEQIQRAKALPQEYKFVYNKISEYLWSHASGDGSEMLRLLGEILDLFEQSALEGQHVLAITGEDVVGFCDELLQDTTKWSDKYRKKLNKTIKKK